MTSSLSFLGVLKKEFLNPIELAAILISAFLYFSISVLLLNFHLIASMLLGNFPLDFKFKLVSAMVLGAREPLGNLNFTLLVITALLVGTNLVTVFKNIKKLKRSGGALTISAGGGAIIGVFVAGCTSCGFSVFALVGLTAAVALFPFEGLMIGLLIIALLTASLIYALKALQREVYCEV